MLIKITNKCRMGCRHCLSNSVPNGPHMEVGVFKAALAFSKRVEKPLSLIISGGEPFEHPNIIHMVKLAKKHLFSPKLIVVATNGCFLDDPITREEAFSLGVLLQVTNDPEFYPHRIQEIDHPTVGYVHKLQKVSPVGRAATNNIPPGNVIPSCYNLRALSEKIGFKKAVNQLRRFDKFCTPTINVDGSIRAGESAQCQVIGTIWQSFEKLNKGLRKPCWCGCVNNLPPDLRRFYDDKVVYSGPIPSTKIDRNPQSLQA